MNLDHKASLELITWQEECVYSDDPVQSGPTLELRVGSIPSKQYGLYTIEKEKRPAREATPVFTTESHLFPSSVIPPAHILSFFLPPPPSLAKKPFL